MRLLVRTLVRGLVPCSATSLAARACVIGLAVVASACAKQEPPTYVGSGYGQYGNQPQAPTRVAASRNKVEIEDDGRPAQAPPARRMHPEEDDPKEPWSPNYGKASGPATRPVEPDVRRPAARQIEASLALPATPVVYTSRRLTETEADAIVARAVSAHEMQRQ
jgi:hypothetical protein